MSSSTSNDRGNRIPALILVLALLGAGGWYFFGRSKSVVENIQTHRAERGDLAVTLLTGGSAQSMTPRQIKIKARERNVQLLELIEEGYRITKQDVENGLVLARLDTTQIEDDITNTELMYEQILASFARSQQDLEIQVKENENRIQKAERNVRFSAMDLRKYLGEELANDIIDQTNKRRAAEAALEDYQAAVTNLELAIATEDAANKRINEHSSQTGSGDPTDLEQISLAVSPSDPLSGRSSVSAAMVEGLAERYGLSERERSIEELTAEAAIAAQATETARKRLIETREAFFAEAEKMGFPSETFTGDPAEWTFEFEEIDYVQLAHDPRLGGEASLKREQLHTDLMLDRESLLMAEKSLEGSKELFANEFIPETELEKEQLSYTRQESQLVLKGEDENIFFTYDFPKTAEQAVAKYEDALRNLARDIRTAETRLTRAKVQYLESQMMLYYRQRSRRINLEQFDAYTIRAEHEGLIVYGDPGNERRNRDEQIREGMTVRQGMVLFTIPDPSDMAFQVQLHESEIKHVAAGQRARIRVEAQPDTPLHGVVHKVSVLPNSNASYYNPEMRVYTAMIRVTDNVDWLRPGMTAEITIGIGELADVVKVPIEAVTTEEGDTVCYLSNGERRVVQVGLFNDQHIEIRQGIEEGDTVVLNPRLLLDKIDDGSSNVALWMPEKTGTTQEDTQVNAEDGE